MRTRMARSRSTHQVRVRTGMKSRPERLERRGVDAAPMAVGGSGRQRAGTRVPKGTALKVPDSTGSPKKQKVGSDSAF